MSDETRDPTTESLIPEPVAHWWESLRGLGFLCYQCGKLLYLSEHMNGLIHIEECETCQRNGNNYHYAYPVFKDGAMGIGLPCEPYWVGVGDFLFHCLSFEVPYQ